MIGYVRTFKVEDKINNLMLLEKHKSIWTKIEDIKNLKLSTLPAYDDKYIKTIIRTYGDIQTIQTFVV